MRSRSSSRLGANGEHEYWFPIDVNIMTSALPPVAPDETLALVPRCGTGKTGWVTLRDRIRAGRGLWYDAHTPEEVTG
jgi:hypothetical protein